MAADCVAVVSSGYTASPGVDEQDDAFRETGTDKL
jgi:hypothetical protein